MGFGSFIQTVLFGIFAGSIYGIAAMGLALVFGVMKILNIAHGELVMIGGLRRLLGLQHDGIRSLCIARS